MNQLPHQDTIERLAEALSLAGAERSAFELAARPEDTHRLLSWPSGGETSRTNLPFALTSFIGRGLEQVAVQRLLRETRLLTLTGVGGCGKTRLALEVAESLGGVYPDGVWLVELAAFADPALLPQAVGAVLGVLEQPGRSPIVTLGEYLQPRRILLVLDNCEHVIAACAALATALLRSCPHLILLATSRERLEVPGERTYLVPPLAVPDPDDLPSLERLLTYDAVQLFLQRAQAHRPEVALTVANAGAVARICARLDGLPLAIELAAARASALPVEQIAARLVDRFRLLTGGPRTVLPRQQTMQATLDWSYDLLGKPERLLLRQLSVFANGWTLDAAEAICSAPLAPSPPPIAYGEKAMLTWDLLDLLSGLVHRSLVVLEDWAGVARYRLLETVRQYAHEKLTAAAELTTLRERHLNWYLALAERAAPLLRGPEQAVWLERLEREHDNLRAALHWARQSGQPALGTRLAGALGRFWWMHGHLSEGRGWLEGLLAQAVHGGAVPAALRAAAGNWAGLLAGGQGDYEHAAALHLESLALCRTTGDTWGSAESLHNLGVVARHRGEYERAEVLLGESLALYRGLGSNWGIAFSLCTLGAVAYDRGDQARAVRCYQQSLTLYRAAGEKPCMASCLEGLADVACAQGQPEQAARLLGAAAALREAIDAPLSPAHRAGHERTTGNVHMTLGDDVFQAAWAAGHALPLEQAIAEALEAPDIS